MAYPSIADYALIGDCHTAALVSREGAIDWCCLPNFDSPAVFCRMLDASRGGFLGVSPAGSFVASRKYEPGTNVLITTFTTDAGTIRVTDAMPIDRSDRTRHGQDVEARHEIVRLVEGLGGRVRVRAACKPTFDFARGKTTIEQTSDGVLARGNHHALRLRMPNPARIQDDGTVVAEFDLSEGERHWVIANFGSDAPQELPQSVTREDAQRALDRTLEYWKRWSKQCTYRGPYRDLVLRSALTLKLLTFEPTGAIVAAPTTSLPELIGGARNWDYRFAWLRDSALTIYALEGLGYTEEAGDFWHWLERLSLDRGAPVEIMYRLDGSPVDGEQVLEHLEGYRGSRPVRIGNAASEQRQLDVFGEVLDASLAFVERVRARHDESLGPAPGRKLWSVLRTLADAAADHWQEPDQGMWEVRTGPRQFLYSKLLCWVAVDRAITLLTRYAGGGDTRRWQAASSAIKRAILEQGYNRQLGAFAQAFDSPVLDASVLNIPLVGMLPATDPRMKSTIGAIRERLTSNGLVYRYLTEDGIPGGEATFAMCSFWLVDNLALAGDLDAAHDLFERVVSYANDVGLLSEEIDPTSRELLGNFPQGFTHLALARSAARLQRQTRR